MKYIITEEEYEQKYELGVQEGKSVELDRITKLIIAALDDKGWGWLGKQSYAEKQLVKELDRIKALRKCLPDIRGTGK